MTRAVLSVIIDRIKYPLNQILKCIELMGKTIEYDYV